MLGKKGAWADMSFFGTDSGADIPNLEPIE
jgi:hypothetical protein